MERHRQEVMARCPPTKPSIDPLLFFQWLVSVMLFTLQKQSLLLLPGGAVTMMNLFSFGSQPFQQGKTEGVQESLGVKHSGLSSRVASKCNSGSTWLKKPAFVVWLSCPVCHCVVCAHGVWCECHGVVQRWWFWEGGRALPLPAAQQVQHQPLAPPAVLGEGRDSQHHHTFHSIRSQAPHLLVHSQPSHESTAVEHPLVALSLALGVQSLD